MWTRPFGYLRLGRPISIRGGRLGFVAVFWSSVEAELRPLIGASEVDTVLRARSSFESADAALDEFVHKRSIQYWCSHTGGFSGVFSAAYGGEEYVGSEQYIGNYSFGVRRLSAAVSAVAPPAVPVGGVQPLVAARSRSVDR